MELQVEATPWTEYTCELGEGVRWTGDRLIHVDLLSGRLIAVPTDTPTTGDPEVIAAFNVPLGAVAPRARRPGSWIAAAGTGVGVLTEPGTLDWIANLTDDSVTPTRVNDGACDPAGRFWVTTMAYDNTQGVGALHRIDPDGTVTPQALTGLTVPNGPAWRADGELMYLAASADSRIDVYTVDPRDGSVGAGRQFVQVDGGLAPDGMIVDDEGFLWVAIWDGAAIHRYDPDGELDSTITLPTSRPTSCCFGGPDRDRLFVTTAAYGLSGEPDAGRVFAIDVGVTGPAAYQFGG